MENAMVPPVEDSANAYSDTVTEEVNQEQTDPTDEPIVENDTAEKETTKETQPTEKEESSAREVVTVEEMFFYSDLESHY